ncbi:hypothetical protein BH11ACT8_BH11ACT8_09950 [soil metagenome]
MAGKRRADGSAQATTPKPKAPPATKRTWQERLTFRNRPKRTWKQRLKRLALQALATGLVLTLIVVGVFIYLYKTIDIPPANPEFLTQTSYVYYDDGKDELGRYATQFRDSVELDEMATDVKDAVVAAENRTFYTDKGIDPKGILRAAFSNASGNSKQGASTITQQYVKILYLTQERSYKRKIKEAILSLKVQRTLSKDEVLRGYLNTIYFGRGAYGVEAASDVFFGLHAIDLNLRQSAVLAAVLNNPSRFDPANGKENKQALKGRYDYVLDSMADVGDITAAEAEKAKKRLPKFPKNTTEESTYGGQKGFMLTMVKDQLLALTDKNGDPLLSEEQIDGGGLRVTTTLDRSTMDAAAQGVADGKPDGFGDKFLHIGVASVEPGTGALRGFYAGQDFLDSQLNWAVEGGQAGSTFKAFALAAGIKDGYSLKDTFDGNSPFVLADGSEVVNEQDNDYGRVNLIKATEESINTAYTDLTVAMDNGPEKIVKMANDMGIPPAKGKKTVGFPEHTPGLSPDTTVALGSATVSPINMANAYATIANRGVYAEPYLIEKVTDAAGKVLYDHKVQTQRVLSADIAADVSYALQQVVETGTGTAARALGRPAAGKTGTATNGNDEVSSAWFAGFTPQMATAVMYVRGKGNEQLKGWLPSYFGGAYPAATWTAVMGYEMEGLPVEDLPDAVYVDGTAPQDGHAPYTPPPSTTKKPPKTDPPTSDPTTEPTKTPTKDPSTSAPPTTQPPTSAPTTSDPCGLLGCPSSSAPPTTAPPTSNPPTSNPPSASANPRPATGVAYGRAASATARPTWSLPAVFTTWMW